MTHTSTRVFKKSSQNGKITTYLGKRDFIDHVDYTESIDGIVLLDPDYVKEVPGRKVLATLSCVFRYGREDLDVLGLTFRRDLYSVTQQIWPSSFNFNKSSENNNNNKNSSSSSANPANTTTQNSNNLQNSDNSNTHHFSSPDPECSKIGADSVHSTVVANPNSSGKTGGNSGNKLDTLTISPSQQPENLTQLQVRLKRKLGENAYPLYFKIPSNCPCSITLQPAPGDTGKPCGIDYELKTWILEPNASSFQNTLNNTNSSPEHINNNNDNNNPNLEGILPSQYLPNENTNHQNNNNNQNSGQNNNNNSSNNPLLNASGKSSTVKLAIRKIQYAPIVRGPQPQADTKQTFWLSEKPVHMEATLDKDLYHHGEKIYVNVQITNNSSKSVKKIKVSVRQFADV